MLINGSFADLLDPRFDEIFDTDYTSVPDMLEQFYETKTGTLLTERWSQIGALPDMTEFTGTVSYNDVSQGYDTTATFKEFAQGIQVERKLVEFDQFDIIMNKPKALAESVRRRRETDAMRPFNNAFSVDTFFYTNTEAVAM